MRSHLRRRLSLVPAVTPAPRRQHRAARASLLAVIALAGCEPALPSASAPPAAPDPKVAELQRQLDRPFVVFSAARLEIDRLGEPVAAPITVGSRPTQETMASDAPDVVSVEADGRLLARREGRARIRSYTGGPELLVTVRVASVEERSGATTASGASLPVGPLSLRPAGARLRLGQIQAFEALTPRGPVAGSWSSSNDQVLAHLQDHLFQATALGRATVCASAAGGRSCAPVEVTP